MSETSLPICTVIPSLLQALQQQAQIILKAPPGAGKSTWLPVELLRQPWLTGKIILLEPRRLAARSIADRLSQHLGETTGHTVGYRMRAESRVSAHTRLEVVTEGVLTRWLQQDPELNGISLIIFDEFHERSLQADLALALALEVQRELRDDLKLLVMSATLDDQRLQQLLPDAPVIESAGRSYPVEVRYQPVAANTGIEEAVANTTLNVLAQAAGSVLVFLPGMAEIERVTQHLQGRLDADTDLCPLYGALSLSAQRQAVAPATDGRRKVVLATNIAETSLTIEGIRLVIDSGVERQSSFDPRSGITRLQTVRISRSSMTQRAGRAGRTEAGICVRLYSQEQAERAPDQTSAQICRSDLSSVWLDLLLWGCHDIQTLSLLDIPPAANQRAAKQLLAQLGALDADTQRLTAHGRAMAALGCDPRHAAMLLEGVAHSPSAAQQAALCVALLEDPPRRADDLRRLQPDLRARQRAAQLLQRLGISGNDKPVLGRAQNTAQNLTDDRLTAHLLATGYPDRIGQNRGGDGRFQLSGGNGARLADDSALQGARWIIAPALIIGANSREARILLASEIDIEALVRQYPQRVHQRMALEWDAARGSLRAIMRRKIGALTLSEQPMSRPEPALMQQALLDWIREQGVSVLPWSEAAVQLRERLRCAQAWLPELAWPDASDEGLLAELEQWLAPSLAQVQDVRGLKQLDLHQALRNLLDWSLRQRLDQALPVTYTVPTGSAIPIRYAQGADPVLAVRLQEMFGEQSSPRIAEGRVALVLELLSPARRPLQITRDLSTFWQGAYKDVQKEMKGRYPKHVWPDDPANTDATRKTKKYWQG
ncbi:MAG: ATP-dependent helicase HrpB [Plesiomonas sp.]|uniref:ATP-dependent helicase HrpB n=2 Tax=Plesiomonas sp. TaxID=2486279 RepID=UPI003F37E158